MRWQQQQQQQHLALALVLLLTLLLHIPPAAGAALGVHSGHLSSRRLQGDSVPGQGFHDWRDALIKANFSSSSSSSDIADQQQQQQQQSPWINIVGLRDRIAQLPGPAAVNTTHPAATKRLAAAKAAWEQANARRATVAAAAAAAMHDSAAAATAANTDLTLSMTPPGTGDTEMHNTDEMSSYGSSSNTGSVAAATTEYNLTADQLELTLMSFVRRHPQKRSVLTVNNQPHVILGIDIPNALQLAVQPSQRHQLVYQLDIACQLGYNTIRIWAFSDGSEGVGSAVAGAWQLQRDRLQHDDSLSEVLLQPAPGVLNATVMREGMDWLVHAAGVRGLRLIMVLANGASTAGGGMQQYTHWVDPALTVVDFYGNDTVKSVFLDYIASLLLHRSSISGVPLREDPVIAGWQLAHFPRHPGQIASDNMLAWIRQMGIFMKEYAPHQLFIPGVEGFFGPHSPHLEQYNPKAQVFEPASTAPHTYTSVCHGVDFWYHHQLAEVDIASAAVYPDAWMACDRCCKLSWTRDWIRAHLRDAVRLQKPLLLAGVGVLRPQPWREQFLKLVHDELHRAIEAGHPLGGIILSELSHPDQPDTSGYGMHNSETGVRSSRPPLADPTERAVADVTWRRFMHHSQYLDCLASQARGAPDIPGPLADPHGWVEGWEGAMKAVADIGRLRNSSSSSNGEIGPAT